jgi:integrase
MSWYEASRHSFTSGKVDAGVPLDEVSQALGHSSPVVTARYYARFVRKTYSKAMVGGLKLTTATVLPFKKTG